MVARAVGVFERYASGAVSLVELQAETGIDHEALRVMIRNPTYNGWVVDIAGVPTSSSSLPHGVTTDRLATTSGPVRCPRWC